MLLLSEKNIFKKILIKLSLNQQYIFSVQQFDDFSYTISPQSNSDNDKGKFIFGKNKDKLTLKEIDEKLDVFSLEKSTQ